MLTGSPPSSDARTRHSETVKPLALTTRWNSEEMSWLAWPSKAGR
jgi:hypothetical protein